ncbi:MAG: hypothetical protein DRP71_00800 [Verrucomicrobia bacterium]|nr:MAG: hypothetical protein DRP71_00800 [Verrucomicrobiota bacterium]
MIRVRRIRLFRKDLRTRMPFRYGIATMVDVPHVFLNLEMEDSFGLHHGISADHLPPKWFTKDPERDPIDEVDEMLEVVRQAIELSQEREAATPFDFWWDLYRDQSAWALTRSLPPLLSNFGVTLVERALIDAWCRGHRLTFFEAVRRFDLGVDLGRIHDELAGRQPGDELPEAPLHSVFARHTVGLADPLRDGDIPAGEILNDGLPQSLEACIRFYGLTHFKLKVEGKPDQDLARLRTIAEVLEENCPDGYAASLDGNESFREASTYASFWDGLQADPKLNRLLERLLFVEQPLHRDIALQTPLSDLSEPGRTQCPVIIDESDAELSSLPQALELGYSGTSHKNCKGVFKGIANRCLINMRSREGLPHLMMSGEDLSNVGPIALLQDLAVQSTLGIESVERNGHHYFAGLSAYPGSLQNRVLETHGDLYTRSGSGPARVTIANGRMSTRSTVDAPFGVGFQPDLDQFANEI